MESASGNQWESLGNTEKEVPNSNTAMAKKSAVVPC